MSDSSPSSAQSGFGGRIVAAASAGLAALILATSSAGALAAQATTKMQPDANPTIIEVPGNLRSAPTDAARLDAGVDFGREPSAWGSGSPTSSGPPSNIAAGTRLA